MKRCKPVSCKNNEVSDFQNHQLIETSPAPLSITTYEESFLSELESSLSNRNDSVPAVIYRIEHLVCLTYLFGWQDSAVNAFSGDRENDSDKEVADGKIDPSFIADDITSASCSNIESIDYLEPLGPGSVINHEIITASTSDWNVRLSEKLPVKNGKNGWKWNMMSNFIEKENNARH